MQRLITAPETRHGLGLAAAKRVRTTFSTDPGLDRLADKFRKVL
jgi:hypothetical protein